jgi:hypothetical protein
VFVLRAHFHRLFIFVGVEEEDAAATMTGVAVAAVDTVTRVASGMTCAAHMFEVIVVTAIERNEAGLREGQFILHLFIYRYSSSLAFLYVGNAHIFTFFTWNVPGAMFHVK